MTLLYLHNVKKSSRPENGGKYKKIRKAEPLIDAAFQETYATAIV
jgi:hypothetical protein